MYFPYRYSQTPRILTAAVSSKIASHPLWLSRQKEKLRAGSFAGLQRSFWSVKRRRTKRRKKRNRIATFKMDSQHRTRSTRGCVIAPIHSFFFLMDSPVSYTGYTSHQHSSSLNWQTPSRFPWHQKRKKITPREKQYAHINTLLWHCNLSSWTANQSKTDLEDIRQCTPLTFTYFLPPCVSRPRPDVLLDSGSSVLHGQVSHCRRLLLLCT